MDAALNTVKDGQVAPGGAPESPASSVAGGGFLSLPGAQDPGRAQDRIYASEATFAGDELTDETALKIVLQDVDLAVRFLQSKNRPTDWESADSLYRGAIKARTWPGTDVPRSNLPMPVVLDAVEKLMPTVYLAFFSDRTPFLIERMGQTTSEAARAYGHLLQWCVKETGFKEEIRLCLKDWLLYGLTAAKWGWKTSSKSRKVYTKVDQGPEKPARVEKKDEQYEISHPTFARSELRYVVFDSSLRTHDCRKGKFVCGQVYITANDLVDLRLDPDYENIPSDNDLRVILSSLAEPAKDSFSGTKSASYRDLQAPPPTDQSSVDPLSSPLELLEYQMDDRIITVLQRCLVIRNQANEFHRKTWLSCAFIDVPGSAHGFGIGKLLFGEQKFQEGVANAWIDSLAITLNPSFQMQKGIGPGAQNIKLSPGKVVNVSGEMKPLVTASVSKEAFDAISSSEQRATRRVGANGGDNVPTQALRTAEGVNSFNQSIVEKLQYEIEIFAEMIFIPALEAFIEVCKDNLQPDEINKILSDADGKAFQGDILQFYNGTCSIQVLTSTKLAARRAAAQLLPMLMQLIEAPSTQTALAAQNKKFNYVELIEKALDLTGWDVEALIQDASPDEVNRMMQMQPGVAQAQAKQNQMQQQLQNQLQVVEAQGFEKAGVAIVKHTLQESSKPQLSAVPNVIGE